MKYQFLILVLATTVSMTSFASSRVESVISQSTDEQLTKVVDLEKTLINGKRELTHLEKQLEKIQSMNDYQKGLISFRNDVAVMAIASALAVAGSYTLQEQKMARFKNSGKVFTHPGEAETALGVLGLTGAALSGVTLIGAEIGVLVTKDEATNLQSTIKKLKINIDKKTRELQKEVVILCEQEPRHEACYLDIVTLFNN